MRAAHAAVRAEWDAFVTTGPLPAVFGDVVPGQRALSGALDDAPGKWRAAILRLYGRDTALGRLRFPATMRLISATIPACTTALFSVLEAGRHLPTHRGPNHAVLRVQVHSGATCAWPLPPRRPRAEALVELSPDSG